MIWINLQTSSCKEKYLCTQIVVIDGENSIPFDILVLSTGLQFLPYAAASGGRGGELVQT